MGCRISQPSDLVHSVEIELGADSAAVANRASTIRTGRFRIANPSVLLHLTIEAFRRNTNASGLTDTWSLWSRSSKGDPVVDLNQLVTANALPDSYELTSGIKAFRGEVVMNSQDDNLTRGPWMVRATWEPGPGCCDMSPARLAQLFSGCELTREGESGPMYFVLS